MAMTEVDMVQVGDYKWKKEYVFYKYIDGLDREITLTVKITSANRVEWVDDYHNVLQDIKLSKKAAENIIKGVVSPFDHIEMYKHSAKSQRKMSDRKTIWKKDNYEITENKGSYRLRVYDTVGKLITGIGINKSSYEMIRDNIVHPSYYIERSI